MWCNFSARCTAGVTQTLVSSRDDIAQIVDIQLRRAVRLLAGRGYQLDVTNPAREYLAQIGCEPDFGARPLKRAIQCELQDPLAMHLLAGKIPEGSLIRGERGEGGLVCTPIIAGEVVQ